MLEEGVSDHCHERMTVKALPGSRVVKKLNCRKGGRCPLLAWPRRVSSATFFGRAINGALCGSAGK
jgi:hypothetical protein